MARMVWLVLVVLAVVALWRGWQRRGRAVSPPSRPTSSPSAARAPQPPGEAGLMVQCTHCGVHLDARDAILSRNRYYCCAAHLEAGETPPSRP